MSTRAQVKIVDGDGQELWFYRHSDGYPKGTMPTLEKFLNWVKQGRIRDDLEQAAGWLVLIGAQEYNTYVKVSKNFETQRFEKANLTEPCDDDKFGGWKCGSYEPCPHRALHGDTQYLYTISLKDLTIKVEEV